MVFFVKLISIAVIVYGCLIILRPSIIKKIVEFILIGNRLYIGAAIRVAIGFLFAITSAQCRIQWIIMFVGGLLMLSGVIVFLIKRDNVVEFLKKLENKPGKQISMLGTVTLVIGVLLALAA